MGPEHVLPLHVRMDLEIIGIKGYFILLRSPQWELHYQIQFSVISWKPLFFIECLTPLLRIQLVYYKPC